MSNLRNLPTGSGSDSRSGDQQDSFHLFTQDELFQQDLYSQFWAYAVPPKDGSDLYSSQQSFLHRTISCENYLGKGLSGAKGLRPYTRAIFNYVPYIVSQNKSMILNNARVEGISASLPGTGIVDDKLTALAQDMMAWQYPRVNSNMVHNGLVVGGAYLWPKKVAGKTGPESVKFDVLFSNSVFPNQSLTDLDEKNYYEIKYRVEGTQGEPFEFYQKITKETLLTRFDGREDEIDLPWKMFPITDIKNIEVPGEVHGVNCFFQSISDIDQVNQIAGDCMEAMGMYGTPIGIVEGGEAPAEGIKTGVHAILSLPQGTFKLLEFAKLGEQMDNVLKWAEAIRKKIPEFDLADIEVSGTALSGHAIRLRLATLISKIMSEQKQYEMGLEKAIQYGLNLLLNNKLYIPYKIDVDLGEILPENLLEKIDIESKKLAIGLTIPKLAQKEIGMTEEEIALVEEEKEENERIVADMQAQITGAAPIVEKFRDPKGKIFQKDGENLKEVNTDG